MDTFTAKHYKINPLRLSKKTKWQVLVLGSDMELDKTLKWFWMFRRCPCSGIRRTPFICLFIWFICVHAFQIEHTSARARMHARIQFFQIDWYSLLYGQEDMLEQFVQRNNIIPWIMVCWLQTANNSNLVRQMCN